MPRVAVIGLGRFGLTLAKELSARNAEVIAIDRSLKVISNIKDEVDLAVRLDSTDEEALKSQQVDIVDTAVVAIGEHFESALLTTTILKKLGVPKVICRAKTETHAEIFSRIGADEVFQPEKQAGKVLAGKLAMPHLRDLIPLDEGFTLIELDAPQEFINKSIIELKLRKKHNVNLVALHRTIGEPDETGKQKKMMSVPTPTHVIQKGDILYLVGPDEALAKLPLQKD